MSGRPMGTGRVIAGAMIAARTATEGILRRRRAGWALVLAALLTSTAVGAAPKKKKAASPDAALIAEARRATAAILRDPGSAQFRNIRIVANIIGSKKVCGEVNAKNGFGGYSGFKPFVFFGWAAIADGGPKDMMDYYSIGSEC